MVPRPRALTHCLEVVESILLCCRGSVGEPGVEVCEEHLDEAPVVDAVYEFCHHDVLRTQHAEEESALLDARAQPCLACPLVGRVDEVAVFVVGPRLDMAFVNRLLDVDKQLLGLVGENHDRHVVLSHSCRGRAAPVAWRYQKATAVVEPRHRLSGRAQEELRV